VGRKRLIQRHARLGHLGELRFGPSDGLRREFRKRCTEIKRHGMHQNLSPVASRPAGDPEKLRLCDFLIKELGRTTDYRRL